VTAVIDIGRLYHKYRVIRKSLRDFRLLRYSSRDGHAEGDHVNTGRDTPSFCPTLQMLDMSNLGDAADVNPTNSKIQNVFLFPVHAMFRHDCPLAVKPASTLQRLVYTKIWRDSLLIDMLFSAVSVLVVAQPSSEVPEGLVNNPVFWECLLENIDRTHCNKFRSFKKSQTLS